jgi:PAS domain-containing protein
MRPDALELRLVSALQRYQTLQRRAEGTRDSTDVLQRCLTELGSALSELRVAQEQIVEYRRQMADLQSDLAAQRAKYWSLVDEIPEAYVVSRSDTTILEVNRAGAELLNVSQRFLVGKALGVFVCEDRAQFLAASAEVTQDGQPASLIVKLRPRERAPIMVDARVKADGDRLQWMLKTVESARNGRPHNDLSVSKAADSS